MRLITDCLAVEQLSLEGIALFETSIEKAEDPIVADQPPRSLIDEAWRDFSCDPFYVEIGP